MAGAQHFRLSRSLAFCTVAAAGAIFGSPAIAADQTYTMKLSLATINEAQHEWCKEFAAAVEKDSGGRIKSEIYPASQLGAIPRQIEGVQFGSIQIYVGPPEFMTGLDGRYEIMSAPGLVKDMAQGVRVAETPSIERMTLGLGADKGLHGIAMFVSQPSSVISRTPIRQIEDFKGKKLRVLAAQMQQEALQRLGATPVAMTLGDVLPAIQQGTIDGALAAVTVYTTMQYYDAAKYVTESSGLPFIFSIAVMSSKWYDTLPKDLQKVVDEDGPKAAKSVDAWEQDFFAKQRAQWRDKGGELISLPADQQTKLMTSLSSVGADLVKQKPALAQDYDTFVSVAKATQ
ncbi:MAG TPA: TRAP transporter substrate-binding protein [Stellaceae bacterium]|nr:TRAP transporter substrate-binding protein [Stellaceae bacterium]